MAVLIENGAYFCFGWRESWGVAHLYGKIRDGFLVSSPECCVVVGRDLAPYLIDNIDFDREPTAACVPIQPIKGVRTKFTQGIWHLHMEVLLSNIHFWELYSCQPV